MTEIGLDLGVALLVLLVLRGTLETALAVVVGAVLLVPSALAVPHLHSSTLTVGHVVVLAAAGRVVLMLRSGSLDRRHLHATPVHLALALLIVVWAAAGVVLAPDTAAPVLERIRLLDIGFAAVMFVVALAFLRALGRPWFVSRLLTVGLAVIAAGGVVEHATGASYGQHVFAFFGQSAANLAGHVLETRGGQVRVRASSDFALSYAWVLVMLLPFALACCARRRRLLLGAGTTALAVLAVYWSYTRSAAVALPAAVVLWALLCRTRRLLLAAAAVAVVAVAVGLADPAVRHHLSLAADQGAVSIRFQRLPVILAAVAAHPFGGLGFGGLEGLGLPTTDNFYVFTYGATGAVGAAALVALLLTTAGQLGRGVLLADDDRRIVAAAAVVGAVAFAVSGLFEDSLFLVQPTQLAFLLVAVATAVTEAELGPARMPRPSWLRPLVFAAAGAAAGAALFLAVPTRVDQERSFSTVPVIRNTGFYDAVDTGHLLVATVCDIASAQADRLPRTSVSCRDDFTAAGVGTLRVRAPSTAAVLSAYDAIATSARRASFLRSFQTQPAGPPVSGRPSGWRTAPASGAVLGLAAGLVLPLPWRRRVTG